ncbi:MAG: alpha/beta fold hydrolase [Acidobacteriota bacterium]
MRARFASAILLATAAAAVVAPGPAFAAEGAGAALSVETALNAVQFAEFAPISLSPDGQLVAYTIRDPRRFVTDPDPRYHSYDRKGTSLFGVGCDVWVTDTSTGATRNLTPDAGNNFYPVWSPDGRSLAFYSDRAGTANLWIWDRASEQSRRASDRVVRGFGGQSAKWSPDGRHLVFPALPEGMTIEQAADLFGQEKPAPAPDRRPSGGPTVAVFDSTREAATANAWSTKSMVSDLVSVDPASGAVRNLTHGVKTAWYEFSPDGRAMGISDLKSFGSGNVFQATYDFLVLDWATGRTRVVAAGVPTEAGNQASWSPDGHAIAWCTSGDSSEGKKGHCRTVAASGGSAKLLTPGEHPSFGSHGYREPRWDPDGRSLYLAAEAGIWKAAADGSGARELAKLSDSTILDVVSAGGRRGGFWSADGRSLTVVARENATKRAGASRIDLSSGAVTTLSKEDVYFDGYVPSLSWDVSADGRRLVFISQDASHPEDLWTVGPDWKNPRRLTHVNPDFDRVAMGATRLVDWRALDGETLRGALLLPAGYEPGKRYPVIVYPYGGSNRSNSLFEFGLSGTGTENMQVFASRGYAVFLPDSRTHPGTPMRDIADSVLSGVAKLIELGIADPERLGVMGHSYGGYSTLSVLVQSKLFHAAVARAGLFNLSGAYGDLGHDGTSLNIQWAEGGQGSMGGSLWQYPSRYIENSPWFYLDRVETPLLIIHGAADARVPSHNADQLFVALRRLGKPVVYARYDGEDHSELYWSYANRLDYLKRVITWFDDHLKAVAAPPPNKAGVPH